MRRRAARGFANRPGRRMRPGDFGAGDMSRPFHLNLPLMLLFCLGPAAAQTMYRCGSTYSQTPCGPTATATRTPSDVPADGPADQQPGAVCAREAPGQLNVPDPTQLRVLSTSAGRAEVITYAGQPVAARRFELNISTVSPAGVWLPARAYTCHLSEDQQRLLKFAARTGAPR